jgi:serine/threonine protein kinase
MSALSHPNIVQLLGYIIEPNNLVFVSEFFPCGSLYELLHGSGPLERSRREAISPSTRLKMALDISRGMNYLHSCNPLIVHRDLKPANLLVESSCKVKVCDFGLSRLLSSDYLPSTLGMGTVQYTSPEVMRGSNVSEKSDVYSFGVVLWELVTLEQPWKGRRPEQVVFAVGSSGEQLPMGDGFQPNVNDLIMDCWHPQARERPSFATILQRLEQMDGIACLKP